MGRWKDCAYSTRRDCNTGTVQPRRGFLALVFQAGSQLRGRASSTSYLGYHPNSLPRRGDNSFASLPARAILADCCVVGICSRSSGTCVFSVGLRSTYRISCRSVRNAGASGNRRRPSSRMVPGRSRNMQAVGCPRPERSVWQTRIHKSLGGHGTRVRHTCRTR